MKNKNYASMSERLSTKSFRTWFVAVLLLLLSGGHLTAQVATIGAGVNAGTTGSNGGPIYRSSASSGFDFSKQVYLYTAAELSAAGINPGDNITSVAWNKSNALGTTATNLVSIWRVYMENTTTVPGPSWSNSNFATQTATATLVYNNTAQVIPTSIGYITLTFGAPFVYTGGNLMIGSDWDCSLFAGSPTTGGFAWRSDNTTNVTFGGSGSTSSITMALQSIRPQIQLGYTAGAPCAGQPNPGNTNASAANVCTGSSVNLSLQNSTPGSGVSYQWQESDDNATWNNFGSSSPSASYVMGATPKYFQCIVTCVNDPNPGISNSVLVGINSLLNCYCAASHSSCSGDGVVNVVLNTLSNPSPGCPGSGNYTYFNPGVAGTQLYKGSTYTLSVTVQTDPNQYTNAWIDFNANGVLDAGEALGATVNAGSGGTANFVFTVPVTAASAITRLRIKGGVDGTFTTAQACGANIGSTYGEIEDYDIEILDEPACIDPPTAGAATSSISQFCNTSTVNVNLNLTGNSGGVGQTYQWQYSLDDVDFFDIVGATTKAWTESGVSSSYYYRCNVTCGTSTVPSTSVSVQAVPPPAAGIISGPSSGFTNQAQSYSSTGESGALQWQARLLPSGTFSNVAGATGNPQNIFFSAPGTYEVQLVTSVIGCTNAISNVVTTVISVAGDNVCDAIPVSIGLNGPYSNVGATTQAGEPVPPGTGCTGNGSWCNSTLTNSVWFTFTVPTGGSGRYGFAGPGWDSQIAIYKAASCGDILTGGSTLWAANDDSLGSPYNSYARGFCLDAGETVYIQVDGYSGTNPAFAVRIDDFGPANPSFSGIGATVCENAGVVNLTPAVAGGTFSGTGVTGSSFDPAAAGAGFHTITYTLSGLDTCYSSSQIVEVVTPTFTYYADADGDTYGNAGVSILSCELSAPSGYSADATDCNDLNGAVNPGATEVCNSIDDDCDGLTDEGFDADGDTYTSCAGDCDDNDPSVYPGATEVCNGVDDDCNLLVDDGLTFITYYADVDADTYGDASSSVSTCDGAPSGYVSDNTDCDDNNAAVNPAATEICNLIDDDCDGLTDENILVAGPISGPAVQCVSVVTGSATFSISPVFDATGYNWTVPAGMNIVSGQGTNSIFVSWTPFAVHDGIIGPLSVTPSNACGGGVSSSVVIDINYTIPVRPSSISGPVKLCPGDVGVYSVLNVARASYYVWSVPTGMTITGGNGTNVINVSVDGSYTGGVVSCSAANGCGVSPARTRAVTINSPAVPASISGQASGVCGATGVVYTAAAVPAATGYTWSVPVGATIMSGQGSISISVDFDGAYAGGSISVVADNSCGSSAARSKAVTGAPAVPGVITGDLTICPGQSGVAYGVATVAGAAAYTWTVPGGSTVTSGQGTKDILMTWGTNPATGLSVYVNASNACGTSLNRALNGISIDVLHCIRLGDQGVATGLNIFPNPATDRATIVFNGTEGADFNLKMVDVTGRMIMNERGTAAEGKNQRELNTNEVSSGVYFIMIEMGGVTEQIRLVIE